MRGLIISGVLITTSRNPTHKLRRVHKILFFSLPNSERVNRGSLSLDKLFNYCWGKRISRLLILENTKEQDLVRIKAYSIEKKPQPVEANITLSNVISLQKHEKKNRIVVEQVHIDFSDEVDELKKDQIRDFFKPMSESKQLDSKKIISINFKHEYPASLIGIAIYQVSSISVPLFTIHISMNCGRKNEK